jgi:uncharacterized protein (TIGR00297 family)
MMGLFLSTSLAAVGMGLQPLWAGGPGSSPEGLLLAGFITLAFTGVARALHGVSRSGAAAGAVIAFLLYLCAGPGAFVLLVSVFVVTLIATRVGSARKQALGTAERHDGRTASQVVANLSPAALAAVLFALSGHASFLAALGAALAEAAADTASSECGQAASSTARLITNCKQVAAGTNGGISAPGTIAGTGAALLIGGVAVALGILSWRSYPIAVSAALVGMFLDSLLGATLERRGILNNDGVNFSSNLVAAFVAFSVAQICS